MKFAVINLGCKVNRVESDTFVAALLARGGFFVPETDAQLIIINTCTVTGEAEKKTRKAVRHALRANGEATVIVTGCAVAIDAASYEALDTRVCVVDKGELLASIRRGSWDKVSNSPVLVSEASFLEDELLSVPLPVGRGFRTRVGVKVQDGCDNACTYCIVHVARGRATSRPAAKVVSECVELARVGVKEIVLTGINLGSYCADDEDGSKPIHLAELLGLLLRETKDVGEPGCYPVRFRISSIEPRDVDGALIELLATCEGRVCRHLHLPLQSGSSKVLREMARPYDVARYVNLVDCLRERVPEISLSTDIIAGFPGETDDEFQETLDTCWHCGFSKIHVFPYSRREGTPAAARADQVEPQVKAARAGVLRALSEELREADRANRVGTRELALVEEGGVAMTESYFEVAAPLGVAPGALVEIEFVPGVDE